MPLSDLTQPVRSKLAACQIKQESWVADHELAMAVFNFEDLLGDLIQSHDDIKRIDRLHHELIVDDPARYDDRLDDEVLDLYRTFHRLAGVIVSGVLPELERKFGQVEHAEELRRHLQEADETAEHGYRTEAFRHNEQAVDDLCKDIGFNRAS